MPKDNSLRKATSIDLSSSGQSFTNRARVGKKDLTDLYTFSLSQSSSVDLSLSRLNNNADIELYQRNESSPKRAFNRIRGREFSDLFTNPFSKKLKLEKKFRKNFNRSLTRLAISKKGGKKNESIIRELDAGEYFIRVRPSKGASRKNKVRYTLDVSGSDVGSTPSVSPLATPSATSTPAATTPAVTTPTTSPVTPTTPAVTTPTTSSVPVPDGNSTRGTALGLTLSEDLKIYGTQDLQGLPEGAEPFAISDTDTDDYYSFNLASRSKVDFTVDGLAADIDVQLLDSNNIPIASSENGGTANESITETLASGEYYLRVYQTLQGRETDYTLSGSALSRDDNDTPETADALPFLSFRSTIFDNENAEFTDNPFSIDADDPVDYFSFELKRNSEIRFSLKDLAGDLNMSILSQDGSETKLAPQTPGVGTVNEVITPAEGFSTDLEVGSYLLKVEAADAGVVSKNYTLDLAAIPEQADGFETGDTLEEAREFPAEALAQLDNTTFANSVRFGDQPGEELWVGGEDPDDYYKISFEKESYISIDLVDVFDETIDGAQDSNLDVQLFRQTSTDPLETELLLTSARPGDLSEVVGGKLDAGTYFIRVFPNDAAIDGSYYQMDLALFPLDEVPALTRDIKEGGGDGITTSEMVSIGTDVFFVANDGTGQAIWSSSGASETEVTTQKVEFDNPQPFSEITDLSVVNNQLYFLGTLNGATNLWTEGASGLEQLTGNESSNNDASDIFFGLNPSGENDFTVVGDTLYFLTTSFEAGIELWGANTAKDGSGNDVTTVSLLTDIDTNVSLNNELNSLTSVDGVLYFKGKSSDQLYRYDPATASTEDLANAATAIDPAGTAQNLIAVDDTLYFTVGDTLKRIQKDDVSSGDIEFISSVSGDITGFDTSDANSFVSVTDTNTNETTLYFEATSEFNGASQTELWSVTSNGTAERLTDLGGNDSADISELTVVGDTLFFAAKGEDGDKELYSMSVNSGDAMFNQASLVKNINTVVAEGETISNPSALSNFIAVDNVLYFAADNGVIGKELWKSDGTEEGTTFVSDIQLPVTDTDEDGNEVVVNSGSSPRDFINVGNRLFFTAVGTPEGFGSVDDRETLGRELWTLGLKDEE